MNKELQIKFRELSENFVIIIKSNLKEEIFFSLQSIGDWRKEFYFDSCILRVAIYDEIVFVDFKNSDKWKEDIIIHRGHKYTIEFSLDSTDEYFTETYIKFFDFYQTFEEQITQTKKQKIEEEITELENKLLQLRESR